MNDSAGASASVRTKRSHGLSLVAKTVVVFVVVALLPAATVSTWLTGLYRGAIETTERQLQTAVLAELSAVVLRRIDDVQADAEAIASALSFAASQTSASADATGTVRALLATRRSIRAIRFEVPDANVSTVIRQSEISKESTPASTAEMRRIADERGVSFAVIDATTAVLVVSVPRAQANSPTAYVAARVALEPLGEALRTVAESRFDNHNVNLLVADGQRRVVAAFGPRSLVAGASANDLPIWNVIPTGTPWSRRVSVVSEHPVDGTAMVGGIETVPRLGWAVASWRPKADAYASLAALTPRFTVAALTSLLLALVVGVFAARTISGPVARLSVQARQIGERQWGTIGNPELRNDEIGDLSRSIHEMARSLEQSEADILRETQLRSNLSRFMSRELVDAIVRGDHSLELGGTKADISVLFADVVAFTPLAESRAPEEMVALLNELFGILSEVVFRHQGTVDKFIGDCIMAVWGVPVAQPDHASRALRAAEEMMRFLELGNEEWRERYGVELRLAIGVNSGDVIVGNIGSKKRMEYTVIGDVVNIAARLEALARPNQILLTDATQQRVEGQFDLHACGEQKLTGRTQATGVFELRTG
jgi:adenylate cyclase